MTPIAARNYVHFLFAGGLSYWLLDILVHAISLPAPFGIVILTVLVPGLVVWTYLSLRRRFPQHPRAVPLYMLLGIWIMGPLGIAIGMIPAGATFLNTENIGEFLGLWLMFPVSTFVMSTYSGSLGGVILVTLALVVCAVIGGRGLSASNPLMQPTGQEKPAAD
jgi:hypothetical protein